MSAVVICGLCAAEAVAAQERPEPTRVWFGGGLASGASRNVEAGFGLLGQLVVQRRHHHASIRALFLNDFAGFPDSGGGDIIGEASLTYGRTRTTSFGHLALSTGLSLISFDACPGAPAASATSHGPPGPCYSAGVPIIAEAALSARVIGIGLQLHANVNPRVPYAGFAVFLLLGWMP